ncbi:MAG TPA: TIGR03560 family F420-dependent LLM class oxidoreductase [Acidimicrobiales bacterium]|nr:TIGR03560 family F420-dependent LLM class oxidoreductase [Acidimicrobiales bacterium]
MTPRTDEPVRFGAFVPQGWKTEFAGWDPAQAWARAKEVARTAELAGYDHLWVYDHVETVPRRVPEPMFEAWTVMAALAEVTSRARLGQLVTCAGYRSPALLAKMAATVDVLSGGRLIFGIGAGWFDEEYRSHGYEYPSDRERLELLEETILVAKALWTEPEARFEGAHARLDGAISYPKPLQSLPPIWVGGGGEKVTLRIAAQHADATNWQVGLDEFVHKSEVLARHCEDLGRDPASIVRTHGPDCILFDTEAEMQRWLASPGGGHLWGREDPSTYVRDNFVGTDEQVAEQVQGFLEAGCSEFVLWFRDYPEVESMERFMVDVVPRLSLPT